MVLISYSIVKVHTTTWKTKIVGEGMKVWWTRVVSFCFWELWVWEGFIFHSWGYIHYREYFQHIYREHNMSGDVLSKEALSLEMGKLLYWDVGWRVYWERYHLVLLSYVIQDIWCGLLIFLRKNSSFFKPLTMLYWMLLLMSFFHDI